MGEFTDYLYTGLWLIIAIYLFYQGFKESKFMFFLSAFFLYMAGWSIAGIVMPDVDMYSGMYGIIFRCIAAVVLVICIIAYIRYRRAIASIMKENKEK